MSRLMLAHLAQALDDFHQERKVRAAREEREEQELVAAAGGASDFRAVAPPVMSFTQGRRR